MPLKTKTSWKSSLRARRNKPKVGTNPLKTDPTRTTTLRRAFVTELYKRFARLKGKIVKLISGEDALGLEKLVGTRNVSTVADLDNPTALSILDSPYTLSWEERQGVGPLVGNVESGGDNCGTGAGGFQPGNTCGKGGGSGEGGDKSILPPNPKTPTDVKVEIPFRLPPRTIAVTKEVVKRFLGGNLQKAAGLVGAQPGANIRLSAWGMDNLMIEVDHPQYHASRNINVDDDGNKFMENESFSLMSGVPKGTGIGLQVFSDQVEHLRAEGFKYIKLDAARGATMNGHYSWARMGCDAKVDDINKGSIRRIVEERFPNATHISDIMRTKEGRSWWKDNGGSVPMKFDLTEGSRSLRILYAYQDEMRKERGGKLTKNVDESTTNEPNEHGEEIELTPEDEDALDKAWEKVIEEEKRRKKETTENFNPNHDERGRFASGEGSGKGTEEISHLVEKIQHPVGKLLYKALSTAEKPVSYPAQLVGLGYKKLSPETRKEFRGAVRQIISSMPKTMLDQMVLKGVVLHENQKSISKMSWWRSTGVVGFYKPLTGILHSDGKDSDDDWSRVGTLAHELMHAADATGKFNMSWGKWNDKEAVKQIGWGAKHSSTPEWKAAMDKEIMPRSPNGLNRLSAYATTDHREAFAEFGRLVHGSDVSHEKIARLFPECTKYFKSNGLWTDRERKASPPSLKEREKAILWGSDKKKYEGLAGKEKKAFLSKLEKQYKELTRDTIAGNAEDRGQLLPELFNHKEEGLEGSHADCWTPSSSQGTVTGNTHWADLTDAERVEAFQDWLAEQFDEEGITGSSGEELWERFTTEGFKRGQGRAFDDLSKSQLAGAIGDRDKTMFYQGNREQFLRSSFGQPVATEKVKLLAGRSFDELEGLTSEMGLKMSRVLTDGLVTGANPRDIAKGLVDQVDLSRTKAELIAQTEIIRAHNEGQLIALGQLGVEEVGVMVEWLTAGFGVCPECEMMEGVVLTLEEAKGLLPKHPRCRCCWLPANVGESKKDQIRGKEDIDDTMDEAYDEDEYTPDIDEERPEDQVGELMGDEEGDEEGLADNTTNAEWDETLHPRDAVGKFSVGGGGGGHGVDPNRPPPSPIGRPNLARLPYGLKELPKEPQVVHPLPKKEAAKFALASSKEIGQVKHIVAKKIKDAPVPSKKELKKMTEALEKAKMYTRKAKAIKDTVGVGKSKAEVTALTKQMIGPRPRTAGESRGNSKDRAKRAQNLFMEFGGNHRGYVVCHISGIKMHWTDDPKENPHGYPKFEQSKIFVTKQGGGSQLSNLIPEARAANRSRNASKVRKENQTENATTFITHGGPRSGNFGHPGRPGQVGGSGEGGGKVSHEASPKELRAAKWYVKNKVKNAPVPKPEKVAKMRAALAAAREYARKYEEIRTSKAVEGKNRDEIKALATKQLGPPPRAGGEARGNSNDRRQRAKSLFKEFGGDDKGYVVCHVTGLKMHYTDDPEKNPNGYPKFEQGKVFTAHQGGGYQLPNLIPESYAANRTRNDKPVRKENLD